MKYWLGTLLLILIVSISMYIGRITSPDTKTVYKEKVVQVDKKPIFSIGEEVYADLCNWRPCPKKAKIVAISENNTTFTIEIDGQTKVAYDYELSKTRPQ